MALVDPQSGHEAGGPGGLRPSSRRQRVHPPGGIGAQERDVASPGGLARARWLQEVRDVGGAP